MSEREGYYLRREGKQLEVFRDPNDGDYRSRTVLGSGDKIAPLSAPGASIPVADLLP